MPVGRPNPLRIGLTLGLTLLAACGPDRLDKTEADLPLAVAAAVARGDTATLRLQLEVPFDLESLYVVAPRTPRDTMRWKFGEDWLPEMSRGIEDSDAFHLMVFVTNGEMVPAVLPRTVADVAPELTGRWFETGTAVFRVSRVAGSAVPVLLPR